MNRYIKIISIVLLVFLTKTSWWNYCLDKKSYDLYQCRIKSICNYYIEWTKLLINTKDYLKAEEANWLFSDELDEAKKIYRENMNNIYKCWILQSQKNSLNILKEKLLSIEKWWELKNKVLKKISARVASIDINFSKIWCKWIDKKSIVNKWAILNQTTYEICRYDSYLQYLKEYNTDLWNLMWLNDAEKSELEWKSVELDWETISYFDILTKYNYKQNSIDNELIQAYRVFPIAFSSYNEYENNFTMHIFLELILEDFIVFRDKFHQMINPINQVVYKISNAMSIND